MPRHDDYTGQLDRGQQHGESTLAQLGDHPISQLFPKQLWIQTNSRFHISVVKIAHFNKM